MTRERGCFSGAAGGACANSGSSESSGTVQGDCMPATDGRRLDLRALFQEQSAAEAELDAFVDRVSGAFLADTAVRNQVPDADAIARHFCSWCVPAEPADVRTYFRDLVTHVVQPATRVASPLMVGHMTTALPFFQRPLARLVAAMNQNVVKTETASTVTFLEREAVARLHHLFFARPGSFYEAELHSAGGGCLGTVTSGGTVANLTALWCARNCALGPREGFAGVERAGLSKALRHFGYEGAVVLGSEYMHYSIVKAADVLGLGTDGVVRVPANESFGVRVDLVAAELERCRVNRLLVVAIVAVAGATETGAIDDLAALADLAEQHGVHLHVDAAWGGPLMFSPRHRVALRGIERATTVTVDGHKQLFTPMGCGVVLFREPALAQAIRKTAQYIIRADSMDAGRFTLEGSRPAAALYLHASLSLLGSTGLAALVEDSVQRAQSAAALIRDDARLELVAAPSHSNIVLYRWIPPALRERARACALSPQDNERVDALNRALHAAQVAYGTAFVSRTTIRSQRYGLPIVCLRVVLANPRGTIAHLQHAIEEQRELVACEGAAPHAARRVAGAAIAAAATRSLL